MQLPAVLRTTTFRLAMVNIVLFTMFSVGLLAFLYVSTVGFIKSEANRQLEAELQSLFAAYRTGGFDRLNEAVAERASAPGPYSYYLQAPDGRKVSGDFQGLPLRSPLPGETKKVPFTYRLFRPDGTVTERRAEGRAVRLSNGGVLLVAFDWEERTEVVSRITTALTVAVPVGLVLSLIGGLVISRSASRRADELVKTAEGVMAGDLARRAPTNQSGDEFDRLSVRLNAMLDWIDRLVTSTRDTGNAIAHDLKSPLTRLRNRLVTALEGPPLTEAAARETLATTLEEVDRVLATFAAILRLSRLEGGSGARLVKIDVSEIATELADMFEPVCEDKGLRLKTEIARGAIVLGDRELLGQAVANLLDNAVKYSPSGGEIGLKVRRGKGETIDVVVTDTGEGIPPEDRARAVKRFVRLESSRSEPGSGLGLALVDAVAEHHHGRLTLDAARKHPTTPGLAATLTIPRAK